jgi:hypothetical protein
VELIVDVAPGFVSSNAQRAVDQRREMLLSKWSSLQVPVAGEPVREMGL